MPPDFVLSFPLRFVVVNSEADDPEAATIYGLQASELFCIAIFTDQDLLLRHFDENSKHGHKMILIQDESEFRQWIDKFIAAGFEGAVFDPGRIGGKVPFAYPFTELLQ